MPFMWDILNLPSSFLIFLKKNDSYLNVRQKHFSYVMCVNLCQHARQRQELYITEQLTLNLSNNLQFKATYTYSGRVVF